MAVVRNGDAVRVVTPTWEREVPAPIRFPRIRALDDDRVLLVDSRTSDYAPNAWILDRHRGATAHFLAGDAIMDIVISPPFIVVTYFDEAFTSDGPAGEGVSFFDFDGQFLWGYRTQFGDEAVDVMDVYAASTDAAGYLWFYPYTEFPLVRLDMHAREQTLFTPPEALQGSHALSIRDDTAYFVGPYQRHGALFAWPLGAPEARHIGIIRGEARGLPEGRFLNRAEGKWSVVESLEDQMG